MADTPADTTPNTDEQVRTFGDGFRLLEGELRTHRLFEMHCSFSLQLVHLACCERALCRLPLLLPNAIVNNHFSFDEAAILTQVCLFAAGHFVFVRSPFLE